MRRILIVLSVLAGVLGVHAQDGNTRMGIEDVDNASLSERLLKIEKKTDAFNFYINLAGSANETYADETWNTNIDARLFRLEIKGNITPKLHYRLRHALNKSNTGHRHDGFLHATDFMMVGYHFNPHFTIQAGKMSQVWGGFEYDEDPTYIYRYTDLVGMFECFQVGAMFSYKPVPSQEIALGIYRTDNGSLDQEFGENLQVVGNSTHQVTALSPSHHPLTYIINWNGHFLDNKLQTRWSWGLLTQARHTYSRGLTLGQRLNLPNLQWYLDFYGFWDGFDRFGIASSELGHLVDAPDAVNPRFGSVHYFTWATKLNWQFRPQWNLMAKGTYETASVAHIEQFRNYRKALGAIASVEYYPVKHHDFRVYLAYLFKNNNYTAASTLPDYTEHRIELGIITRLKLY